MDTNNQTKPLRHPEVFAGIISNDPGMTAIFHYIESVAETALPVLITGETGVGKEMIVRTIHNLSGRKGRFVAVNVAGLDDNMFSDTLFGHERGAFTGADHSRKGQIEYAKGGSLFLDEIGDLSQASQVKLLRLIQEGEYLPLGQDAPRKTDVRILAATNHDLWLLQRQNKFRQDLNFRLRTHHIHIPPLRERRDDIPSLVDHFLEKASRFLNREKPSLPKKLFPLLNNHSFPGNIRELETIIFDAVARNEEKVLSLDLFKSYIAHTHEGGAIRQEPESENQSPYISFHEHLPTIKQAMQLLVAEALKRSNGNQTIAAGMLGISQQALSKRLKKK